MSTHETSLKRRESLRSTSTSTSSSTSTLPGREQGHEGSLQAPAGQTDQLSLDQGQREKVLARLRRIEGQVRGLQRMIEEGRYCGDVLAQIAAVQSSLRGAGEVLLQSHLRHCLAGAVRAGDEARAERIYDELTGLFRRYGR